jgi:hypothetical protein
VLPIEDAILDTIEYVIVNSILNRILRAKARTSEEVVLFLPAKTSFIFCSRVSIVFSGSSRAELSKKFNDLSGAFIASSKSNSFGQFLMSHNNSLIIAPVIPRI